MEFNCELLWKTKTLFQRRIIKHYPKPNETQKKTTTSNFHKNSSQKDSCDSWTVAENVLCLLVFQI